MNEELRDEVAGVLGEHDDPPGWMWSDSDQMVYACECGDHYVAGAIDVIQEQDVLAAAEWHRNHQADALMPLLERRERETGARALRDAADEWAETRWYDVAAMQLRNSFVSSLRDRADAITSGDTQRCHSHSDEARACQFSAGRHCACDTSGDATTEATP